MKPAFRLLAVMLFPTLLFAASTIRARLAAVTFQVNSLLDEVDVDPGDGLCRTAVGTCTLRAAVMQSNVISGSDVEINLPAGEFRLTRLRIAPNGPDVGDLNLTDPSGDINFVTYIKGAGAAATIIDAGQLDRAFTIDPLRYAYIEGVTVRNGLVDTNNGETGGGILNLGRLILIESTVSDSVATWGGGVSNFGRLALGGVTIRDNTAFEGGGLHTVRIFPEDSSAGVLTVDSSTISGNHGGTGGGIGSRGDLFLTNSTVSSNTADGEGGGIYNAGLANIYNTTIVFNHTAGGQAGGVYTYLPGAVFNLRNTLLAGNSAGETNNYIECVGDLVAYGRNLIGINALSEEAGCAVSAGPFGSWGYLNNLTSIGPLSDNGGRTRTHALLPGSNAVDDGDPQFGCVDRSAQPLLFDQRGAARSVDGDNDGTAVCDVGAYEYQALYAYFLPFVRR